MICPSEVGCRLYVGSHAATVQGERDDLGGDRCFTAAHQPPAGKRDVSVLLDSGAFSDPPHKRLTPGRAFERQLAWERKAGEMWGYEFRAEAIVSYDLLIDETWVAGARHKRRWGVCAADDAVRTTVEAARYLADRRAELAPRTLVLACQGVDAVQYEECVREVLKVATPADWVGLGGWCILGRFTSWLPTFWATLYHILPLIAAAGVRHVHIFGVLYQQAIGGLVWLADRYGLSVSCDSAAPILAATRRDPKKAGLRAENWRDNVEWWRSALANIRQSVYYRQPPRVEAARQLEFIA